MFRKCCQCCFESKYVLEAIIMVNTITLPWNMFRAYEGPPATYSDAMSTCTACTLLTNVYAPLITFDAQLQKHYHK